MSKARRTRLARMLAVGFLALLLTGCWDQRPVNERDIVTTIGVDPGPSPGDFRWAFVFPNPTSEPTGVGGTSSGPQVFSTAVLGKSLAGALSAAQRANTRELFMGHIRMLALSTKLSPSAWYRLIDAVNRMGPVVETLWVVAARTGSTAAAYVPPSEQVPEVGTYQALGCGCLPVNWGKRLWQTWVETETPGASPTVPYVNFRGNTLHFDQIAVLSPTALTVWPKVASEGWSYLTSRAVRAAVTVTTGHGEVWAVQGVSGRAHVTFRNGPDGVTALVTLREDGVLSDHLLAHEPAQIAVGLHHRGAPAALPARLHLAHEAGQQRGRDQHQQHLRPLGGEGGDQLHSDTERSSTISARNTNIR